MGAEGHIKRRKGRFWLLAIVLILLAILGATRYQDLAFDVGKVRQSFRGASFSWLLAALALVGLGYVGRAWRWQVMISPAKPQSSFWGLVKATLIGFTAVTLFGRPGEIVRPYLIAVRENLSLSSQLAVWFLERLYDLLCVVLIFGFALTRVELDRTTSGIMRSLLATGGWVALAVGLLCVAVLFYIGLFREASARRLTEALRVLPEKYQDRIGAIVTAFVSGMESTGRRSHVIWLVTLSFGEWLLIIASVYCLFQSFAPTRQLTLTENAVFLGFVAFGSIVQLPGIGGGMQVASVLVLTELFGLGVEPATGAALLMWFSTFVAVVPVGLAIALWEGVSWRTLRTLEPTNVLKDGES